MKKKHMSDTFFLRQPPNETKRQRNKLFVSFATMNVIECVLVLLLSHVIFSNAHISSTSRNDDPFVIEVNWSAEDCLLHTTLSLKIVNNPLVSRQFSPIGKQVFASL
jgi:hypothetical protein